MLLKLYLTINEWRNVPLSVKDRVCPQSFGPADGNRSNWTTCGTFWLEESSWSEILQARRLAEGQRLARLIAGVQKPLRHRRHKPVTQESDKNWSPKMLWVGFANSTNANAIIYSSLRKCQSARKCSDTFSLSARHLSKENPSFKELQCSRGGNSVSIEE